MPWCARSENAVDEDGERFLAPGVLPEGRRSSARRGCGAVTVGREGTAELDFELWV